MDTKSVQYNRKKISYRSLGAGRPLMLLHGYQSDSRCWERIAQSLSDHYLLLLPDLPGHGKSELLSPNQSIDDLANTIRQIALQENLNSMILAGHSMGGYVALAFATLFHEMTRRLILINSHPWEDSPEKRENREREISFINKGKKEFIIKSVLKTNFAKENQTRLKDEIRHFMQIALEQTDEGCIAMLNAMKTRPERTKVLRDRSIPTLCILGEHDPHINSHALIDQYYEYEQLQFELLEHAGHMSFVEEQEQVAERIKTFLK